MRRLSRVSVSSPLAEFAVGFAERLGDLGYSQLGARKQLRLMKDLSSWLAAQGLSAGDMTGEVVVRFVAGCRARHPALCSERGLAVLLGFLREQGAVPWPVVVTSTDPVEVLLGRFTQYLASQRGLAPVTVVSYGQQVRPFLTWHEAFPDARWQSLTSGQVEQFMRGRAVGQQVASIRKGTTAVPWVPQITDLLVHENWL